MRWDGSSWETVPSPNIENAQAHILSDVACATPSDCWAVGSYITAGFQVRTLIIRWEGDSWALTDAPQVGLDPWNGLNDVTCVSSSECWAVGFNTSGTASTLIMRWDGQSWAIHDSPNPGAHGNVLHGVTCVSPSDCWAVGSSFSDAATKHALALHWDGTSWDPTTAADALAAQESVLSGVTCVSTSDCWAVGHSFNGVDRQSLVERWDGSAWTTVLSSNAVGPLDTYLSRVSCASATDCWAVGYSNDSTTIDQRYILRWDGNLWTPVTLPDPLNSQESSLADVACLSGSDCWAFGSVTTGTARSLLSRWDGTSWNDVESPKVVDPEESHGYLHGVTCAAEDDCWAVGFYFSGQVARSLIMRWDGTSWGIVDSPNVGLDRNNYLDSVTCTSPSDCWVVGRHTTTGGTEGQTLILHWDGETWTIVPSSPADTSAVQSNALTGISCVSASECVAVGHSIITGGRYQGFAMHWDGTSWTVDAVPPREDAETFYVPSDLLYDVSCVAPSDCWAVGAHWSGLVYRTLAMHWDGTRWTPLMTPNITLDRGEILSGIDCVATDDCWAVGSADEYEQGLVQHWDGTSWTIVESPQTGTNLNDVTCLSASDCWAAGSYYTPHPPAKTLVVRWDGTSWTKAVSPNKSPMQSNYLAGIACASSTECWAVGRHSSGSKSFTVRYGPKNTGSQKKATALAITAEVSGQYSDVTRFAARLTDSDGTPLEGEGLTFTLAGDGSTREFTGVTDGDGVASVTPALTERPGSYQLTVRFSGDDGLEGSSDAAGFVVDKEGTAIELQVQGQGSSKTLRARLMDFDSTDGVVGRTIHFYSDSELIGSAQTDASGVATVTIPAAHRGAKRKYEAVFAGDDFYRASADT